MQPSTLLRAFLLLPASVSTALTQDFETARVTQEVLAAEDARFAAMMRADTAALNEMLGDDLIYVHSSGRTETKMQFLNAVGSRAIQYLSFVPVERQVTVLDAGAAIVMGRADVRVILGGQQLDFDIRYIGAYGRAAGRWQLRGWQTTRVAPPSGG